MAHSFTRGLSDSTLDGCRARIAANQDRVRVAFDGKRGERLGLVAFNARIGRSNGYLYGQRSHLKLDEPHQLGRGERVHNYNLRPHGDWRKTRPPGFSTSTSGR